MDGCVQSVNQLSAALNWGRGLLEGGGALLFIAKTYSCWELTFASAYYRSTSVERMRAIVLKGCSSNYVYRKLLIVISSSLHIRMRTRAVL
jgi:hypothetical protein